MNLLALFSTYLFFVRMVIVVQQRTAASAFAATAGKDRGDFPSGSSGKNLFAMEKRRLETRAATAAAVRMEERKEREVDW